MGVVALVVRAAGPGNHQGLSESRLPRLPSNMASLPSFLKEINYSLLLFLSVSQQGCLTLKALGIKDPGICVVEPSVFV